MLVFLHTLMRSSIFRLSVPSNIRSSSSDSCSKFCGTLGGGVNANGGMGGGGMGFIGIVVRGFN